MISSNDDDAEKNKLSKQCCDFFRKHSNLKKSSYLDEEITKLFDRLGPYSEEQKIDAREFCISLGNYIQTIAEEEYKLKHKLERETQSRDKFILSLIRDKDEYFFDEKSPMKFGHLPFGFDLVPNNTVIQQSFNFSYETGIWYTLTFSTEVKNGYTYTINAFFSPSLKFSKTYRIDMNTLDDECLYSSYSTKLEQEKTYNFVDTWEITSREKFIEKLSVDYDYKIKYLIMNIDFFSN